MRIIRWNPSADLLNLHSELDRIFNVAIPGRARNVDGSPGKGGTVLGVAEGPGGYVGGAGIRCHESVFRVPSQRQGYSQQPARKVFSRHGGTHEAGPAVV